jgi:hypothetical protein
LEALEKRELAGFIKPLWRYVWEHRSRPSLDELSSTSDHELLAIRKLAHHRDARMHAIRKKCLLCGHYRGPQERAIEKEPGKRCEFSGDLAISDA